MKKYILENEKLSVTVVPELGGKTISIYEKEKGFELLAGKRKDNMDSCKTSFADCAAFGFDDAFPCIDAGKVLVERKEIDYPDHGEIWSSNMQIKAWDEDQATLQLYYESPLLHYGYEKKITLREHSVRYSYRITNQSGSTFPCIWAFHCLVRYEEDMRIVFPKGTDTFENVMESPMLGKKGIEYHVTEDEEGLQSEQTSYCFDRVPDKQSRSMEKYYVKHPVGEGVCGYDYPSQEMKCRIYYDPKKLPYLGFFVTAGGFCGDYNCALEPCDGYYDSVEHALNEKRCILLEPGECREFEIDIVLE